MKALSLFLLVFTAASTAAFSQNIWIVDNGGNPPGGDHVLTSLQAAIDSATAGDIIHVMPTNATYGNITIDKPISIYGIGFNPNKEIPNRSIVGTVNFAQGANDVRVSGLVIDLINLMSTTGIAYSQSDIQIDHNSIGRINLVISNYIRPLNNVLIRNNNITGEDYSYDAINLTGNSPNGTTANVIISNNVINDSEYSSSGGISGNALLVKNNLFYGNGTGNYEAFGLISNSTVSNNIFYGSTPLANGNSFGNNFTNNLSYSSSSDSLPTLATGGPSNTGSGNLIATEPSITNISLGVNYDYNFDLTPLDGSPLLNAGTDGTNIGPTGGSSPWNPNGSPLPFIQAIQANDVVRQGDNINVTIKARSDN